MFFAEIKTVDYKLVNCLQINYVNDYILSFQGFEQILYNREISLSFEHSSFESFL